MQTLKFITTFLVLFVIGFILGLEFLGERYEDHDSREKNHS